MALAEGVCAGRGDATAIPELRALAEDLARWQKHQFPQARSCPTDLGPVLASQ